eukprot:CAMPEP_0119340138 /NCGR_PEP_ID=MMETSP1333-20130426/99739_1 /TAXON_ID=418940 /ORGANISM="Scyphosphaera apsteinii, Strain RCC1455" /LENGTH=152 /DNA_ID=CAMNT_0007351811 /DNA_START=424 /DNA_END=882 /DNA_ORIENTATION=+
MGIVAPHLVKPLGPSERAQAEIYERGRGGSSSRPAVVCEMRGANHSGSVDGGKVLRRADVEPIVEAEDGISGLHVVSGNASPKALCLLGQTRHRDRNSAAGRTLRHVKCLPHSFTIDSHHEQLSRLGHSVILCTNETPIVAIVGEPPSVPAQ